MEHVVWLIPLGFVIGAYGTLIGAGGGFILVPLLLLLYPNEKPEIITSISLAVVFFNAFSGTIGYARNRRVDYKSGILLAAAAIPGSVLGALSTSYVPRRVFDGVLGALMIAAALLLLWRPIEGKTAKNENSVAEGGVGSYTYSKPVAVLLSLTIGYVSGLLGIGGGIVHVPALIYVLNFPVHIATATSHFVLAVIALSATVVHIVTGNFTHGITRTIMLTIGVIFGAQLGVWFSGRMRAKWIMRGLAFGLIFLGARVLWLALYAS